MIKDTTQLTVPVIQYLFIPPINDLPGLFQSRCRFEISDKNYTSYNADTITALEQMFDNGHTELLQCLKFINSEQESKLTAFKDKYKEDFIRIVKDATRQIEMFLDISLSAAAEDPQIYLYYDFGSELRFILNNITKYHAMVTQIRHSPFQTSIWTPPPKHLFERNFRNYHKVFNYV